MALFYMPSNIAVVRVDTCTELYFPPGALPGLQCKNIIKIPDCRGVNHVDVDIAL
jgi:hypothetical protein